MAKRATEIAVVIECASKAYELDVLFTPPARTAWGEEPDLGELELPDRANDGTTLARIIGAWMIEHECGSLEEAEDQIRALCDDACVEELRNRFDERDF